MLVSRVLIYRFRSRARWRFCPSDLPYRPFFLLRRPALPRIWRHPCRSSLIPIGASAGPSLPPPVSDCSSRAVFAAVCAGRSVLPASFMVASGHWSGHRCCRSAPAAVPADVSLPSSLSPSLPESGRRHCFGSRFCRGRLCSCRRLSAGCRRPSLCRQSGPPPGYAAPSASVPGAGSSVRFFR